MVRSFFLDSELVRLLDDGLAALGKLHGRVGFIASLLELVALVRCGCDVVRLDFVDFGFRLATTPVPRGCDS